MGMHKTGARIILQSKVWIFEFFVGPILAVARNTRETGTGKL